MRWLIAVGLLLMAFPAGAQVPPYVHAPTVGTSASQVLGTDNSRKRLIFFNPSSTATIAVCPSVNRDNGAAITCAVNGAGSITILPLGSFIVDSGAPGSQGFAMPGPWNAVASGSSTPFTILEFY